jgi:ribosome-associated toxin RatA of RatAB toxin-antitoxin module
MPIFYKYEILKLVMAKFEVDVTLPSNSKKLFELATDFENFKRFSPAQIKNISIIEQSNNEIITEEVLTFNTIFKNLEIKQKTKHLINYPKLIESTILEGPFSKTNLKIHFSDVDSQTKIVVSADVKISLKYSILSPIISRLYKGIVMGLIYKMNNVILKNEEI